MIIKKSKLKKIINEAIDCSKLLGGSVSLPSGEEVPFGSDEHIKFVEDTLNMLLHLRDNQPIARPGGYSAASRKVYGDAARERRKELRRLIRHVEKVMASQAPALQDELPHGEEE